MSTIEIKNLTKRYGEAEVLSNINMKLESGKIYGLVGRNGSGKTMLMKHILGFVKATQGTILINGKVVGENDDMQENIGAIIENPGFLPEYAVSRFLIFSMLFRSIPVCSEIRHFYLSICLATILYMISCYPSSAHRYLLCDAVDIATANDDLPCKDWHDLTLREQLLQ